jgi:hypothetical protein
VKVTSTSSELTSVMVSVSHGPLIVSFLSIRRFEKGIQENSRGSTAELPIEYRRICYSTEVWPVLMLACGWQLTGSRY